MSIRWDSENDWENNQDSSGTVGRNGELKQGYSRERPPLSDGLVGYWPLHDSSATDYSGNSNHGNLNGGVTTGVAGKGGLQAMSFDGSDDYISLEAFDAFSSFTFTAWVKPEAVDTDSKFNNIIIRPWVNNDCGMHITDAGVWGAYIYDGATHEAEGSPPETDEWIFICATWDGSKLKIWEDGIESGSVQVTGMSQGGNNTAIGYDNSGTGTRYFNGEISNVRVYNRALPQSEIQALYEGGSGDYARPPTDGVAHYKLDGDAKDSWNSNDGTTNGGLTWTDNAIRGQAASFDGNDDSIETSVDRGVEKFTFSFWMKPHSFDGINNSRAAGTDSGSYQGWSFPLENDNTVIFTLGDGSSLSQIQSRQLATGSWYHIVGTYDPGSNTAELYINVRHEGSTTVSLSEGGALDLGEYGNNGMYFKGILDDVRYYSGVLTPQEIFEIYRYGTRGRDMRKQLVNH